MDHLVAATADASRKVRIICMKEFRAFGCWSGCPCVGKSDVTDQEDAKELNMIQTVIPEELKAVRQNGGLELLELAVNSGASETVIGEDLLIGTPLTEGEASRRGVEYEVARGVRIPNLGEKSFPGYTTEGVSRKVKAQVCDVNKALLSVQKVVAAGNKVVFDERGSYIEDKTTHERMWLQHRGGMYMLQMWVKHAEGF